MTAAAQFLSGKHPSARQAAHSIDCHHANVSHYVKLWRDSGVVDVMVGMYAPPPPPQEAEQQPEQQPEAEAINTSTDAAPLMSIARLGEGNGYNLSGTDEAGYKLCYKWAAAEYVASNKKGKGKASEGAGYRTVSMKLQKLAGVYINYSTIKRAVDACSAEVATLTDVSSPQRLGFSSPYPADGEAHLVKWIKSMRAFKLPVFKSTVMSMANAQIKGTEAEGAWKDGVTNNWYYRFLKAHGLTTGTYRPLEVSRAQWTTSANMLTHYKVLEDTFLEAGIAVKNPDHDPTKPLDEPIKITHPQLLFSWDESKASLDMKQGGKSKGERIVKVDGDGGETIANQGGGEASIVCGSYGDGHSIPPMSIFAATSILPRWTDGGPNSTKIDPATGRAYPGTFAFNDTGAMKDKLTTQYMQKNVFAAMEDPPPQCPTGWHWRWVR